MTSRDVIRTQRGRIHPGQSAKSAPERGSYFKCDSPAFLGEIQAYSFGFAPKNWAMCQGQLLPIQQFQALFSLLGTTYGGNGVNTFALPDLRSRVPIHWGAGPGLSTYVIGEKGGVESVTLTSQEIPAHTHQLKGDNTLATAVIPNAGVPAAPGSFAAANNAGTAVNLYTTAAPAVPLNPGSATAAGGSQAHSNLQPYLAVNYCIALSGIFPSRN